MFKIKGNNFHVTRGDAGSFNIKLDDYTFQSGDILELNIYREYGMDSEPLKTISLEISEATTTATMTLTGTDTTLENPITEKQTYWYEISLNGDQTPFCYDENGPKYFYVYPGGVD
jgi:hypothetical protein